MYVQDGVRVELNCSAQIVDAPGKEHSAPEQPGTIGECLCVIRVAFKCLASM